jgi:class 3 adenylate cyclase/CHASE2 domain-containing sensor protein
MTRPVPEDASQPLVGARAAKAPASSWRAGWQRLDRRAIHFGLIALLSIICAAWLRDVLPRVAEYLDNLPLDNYYYRHRKTLDPRLIANTLPNTKDIVLIDTSYLMPRPLQARLLRKLRLAKVVAFDFMFVDQENELSAEERPLYRHEVAQWRRDTAALAQALRENGNVILGTWPEQIAESDEAATVEDAHTQVSGGKVLREVWQRPPDVLWRAARGHAHLAVEPDMTRHVHLFQNTPVRTPCLGLAIVAAYLGMTPQELSTLRVHNGFLQLKNHRVRVGSEWMCIDYVGGRQSFESLENHAVYTAALDYEPEDFKDKIVIIGESSRKSKEILDTPSGPMPGMQIHANIVATLLSARGAPIDLGSMQTVLIALAACLLLIAPLLYWPLSASFFAALTLALCTYFLSQWVFAADHRVLPLSLPLFAIALTYNAVALYEYRRARETLGRFIGHEMVAPTLSLFSRLRLGGRVEEASAFFCDLRGYTALSEKLAPDVTARLIGEYTSTLVRVVRKHGGRPIDYQGDGAFMLFEPMRGDTQFARRAIAAALELQIELHQLQQKWQDEGADVGEIAVGIGIETGPMMIGLIGADEHLKQGAIGDAVNVAARVQQLNLTCGYSILLTRATRDRAGEEFCAAAGIVSCGTHQIRGRAAPLDIFGAGMPLIRAATA